jgi:hypothetical protein
MWDTLAPRKHFGVTCCGSKHQNRSSKFDKVLGAQPLLSSTSLTSFNVPAHKTHPRILTHTDTHTDTHTNTHILTTHDLIPEHSHTQHTYEHTYKHTYRVPILKRIGKTQSNLFARVFFYWLRISLKLMSLRFEWDKKRSLQDEVTSHWKFLRQIFFLLLKTFEVSWNTEFKKRVV